MQTALGHLYELIDPASGSIETVSGHGTDDKLRQYALRITSDIAHYVVSPQIVDLVCRPEVLRSISALVRAGIHDLPFDPILIEYHQPAYGGYRVFCRLQTKKLYPTLPKAEGWSEPPGCVFAYGLQMSRNPDDPNHQFLSCVDPAGPVFIDFTDNDDRGFVVTIQCDAEEGEENRLRERLGGDAVIGMAIALLMLNTRGVEKQRVETAALNKARAKKGRRAIADYTTIRVGALYDRAGKVHHVDGLGRHMPVHWRASHVRHVRCGPKWSETRPVVIPACLVNFDPADGMTPRPPRHLVSL